MRQYGSSRSVARAIWDIMWTAAAGSRPTAVSCESITASVPSKIALATSATSARVGRVDWTIDSSICVRRGLRLLDLRDHRHVAAVALEPPADRLEVLGPADERERDQVDAHPQ